ncbi:hypothetical protein [Paenibacillus sp. ISL-20]|uniref:hypothetical protein n=1 Tax=Paenibacillus sp. ISL-20 TaxID=2819163 RepID=UPI001BE5B298|nr:hypothetical protein [Paenibacillus sp. ISL-20]MBT2759912.1 hypothetical protein [Paenibacillus sp. ISL-20]
MTGTRRLLLMDDNLKRLLGIKDTAIELIAMINFLFEMSDYKELVYNCIGSTGQDISKYVHNKRREKIMNTRYSNIDEFTQDFKSFKGRALERLFQEPLNAAKLAKLEDILDDPVCIYELHCKQKPDIRFMNFVRLI